MVRDGGVHNVSAVRESRPVYRYPLPDHDPLIAALPGLRPLAPVASPRKSSPRR